MRSAIAYAGANNMSSMDWMLLAEDDTFFSIGRLRAFLSGHSSTEATFFGSCACGRVPGLAILSAAAWAQHGAGISACEPEHKRDRIAPGHGESDRSMFTCIQRLRLPCRVPIDEHGHRAIFVHTKGRVDQATAQMLRLLTNVTSGSSFCKKWNCAPRNTGPTCWSRRAFGFHGMPLKSAEVAQKFHAALSKAS